MVKLKPIGCLLNYIFMSQADLVIARAVAIPEAYLFCWGNFIKSQSIFLSIHHSRLRFLSTAEPWLSIVQIFDKVLRYFDKRRSLSKTYLAIFGATLATFFKHMVTLVPRYSASHSPYPEMNQFLMNF